MANNTEWQQEIDKCELLDIRPDRLQQLIDVMQRVKYQSRAFSMLSWLEGKRYDDTKKVYHTEAELHKCGTSACLGGWLAVSPEFKAVGGRVSDTLGCPVINGNIGGFAVLDFLTDVTPEAVKEERKTIGYQLTELYSNIYWPERGEEITIDIVLTRLRYVQNSLTQHEEIK